MSEKPIGVEYGFTVLRHEPAVTVTLEPLTFRMVLARVLYAASQVVLLAFAVLCFAYVFWGMRG